MQFLVLVLPLVGLSWARPDVSELNGYNYNQPSNGNGISGRLGSGSVPTGSYLPGQTGNVDIRFNNGFGGGNNGFSGNIGFSGSNGFTGGSGYNNQAELVQDQKHVYFFAAPEEEEQTRLRINVASSGQKNTKIIFIKAPSSGQIIPEVIAPPSQSEDKTLVYVLVKKPEQQGAITIPAASTVKQAKPEVYFIKYKTKQEAEQAVASGLGEQAVGSGVQNLADEQSFLRTIKEDSNHQGGFGGGIEGSSLLGAVSGGGGSGITLNGGGSNGGASISASLTGGGSKYGPPSGSGPY